MKIKFTKDLRGRILNQDIVPTNITLEEAIQRLKNLGYDITKLSAYAKRVCDSYKLNRILGKLRDVDEEKSKILIRENILNLYGDDIGDNCLNVYLVAYCVNKYPELSVISAVKKIFEEEEIRKAPHQIRTIVTTGLSDGVFLNIIEPNGKVIDVSFINKWTYVRLDNVFNEIILRTEDDVVNRNRFLIYDNIIKEKIDFQTNVEEGIIKKQKKTRLVYEIKGTNEKIALKYLKKRLDLEFSIKYANRNCVMRELFSIIENISCLGEFTIFRFDFKNFFESVDARKFYDNYIEETNLKRFEKNLLKQLTELYNYCYAGLPTSNAFVEIIASRFDLILKSKFRDKGLCFYARYVDDGILVFNEFVKKIYIQELLDETIEEVFNMPRVRLNMSKTCYLTKCDGDSKFDYLGYQFVKNGRGNKTSFQFGIADSKIEKYQNKIDCIFKAYIKDNNIELLRHRLLYFISRSVFYTNTNSRFLSLGKWDVNGVIENYCLLRKYMKNTRKLIPNTKVFLCNSIHDKCLRNGLSGKRKPYFLRGDGAQIYSIAHGLEKNKTIIFHPNIGWDAEYLKAQILKLDSSIDLRQKSYRELSKIYYHILEL